MEVHGWQTAGLFDLGTEGRDELDVRGGADLRDQQRVDDSAGAFHHLDDVAVAPVGIEPVDPDADGARGPIELEERLDRPLAREVLVLGGHGVLEIEEHQVRPQVRRLLERALVRGRDGQLAAVEPISDGHWEAPRA